MRKSEYIYDFLVLMHRSLVKELPEEASEEEYIKKSYEMSRKGSEHRHNRMKEAKDD